MARRRGTDPARRFVVQRHRARRLHYDLRLEVDGVLVSWAVPRGPTLDPAVRRHAVHVDDHPMEYLLFEGVIPAGTYGGGDVIVWDEGTWEPYGTGDPAAAVAAGELHADLYGHKLRGRLVLVRLDGRGGDTEQWLLLHKRDDHAVEGWDPEHHPRSVLSGRTSEEVAADPDRLWRSDLPADQASVDLRAAPGRGATDAELAALAGLGSSGTWEVFGRRLRLAGLDDELVPGRPGRRGRRGVPALSRRELISYTARVVPAVMPHLAGRPLSLLRRTARRGGGEVVQSRLPTRAPAWLPRWDGSDTAAPSPAGYLVADEPAALVWAAAHGGVEWRPWASRTKAPDLLTHAVLVAGGAAGWDQALVLARLYRTALDHLGLHGHPKLDGRGGVEIWVPIRPGPSEDEVRRWVEELARAVGEVAPDASLSQRRPAGAGGRRSGAAGPGALAPYSPCAMAGAPVSVPVSWDDLEDAALRPDDFTVRTPLARLTEHSEAFRRTVELDQVLPRLT